MLLKFDKIYNNVDELPEDLSSPFTTAALLIHAFINYKPEDPEVCYKMIQKLMGEAQTFSNFDKSFIKDQMSQGDKWKYIGKSYFKGAVPENDYTPSEPFEIEVKENDYSYQEEGYARLLLKSGGADNERFITKKDERWKICYME